MSGAIADGTKLLAPTIRRRLAFRSRLCVAHRTAFGNTALKPPGMLALKLVFALLRRSLN
jgi:hypothetical protein